MPTTTDPADLPLAEHRRRAGHAVDAAIAAAAERPYGVASLGPVQELRRASPEELRSIVIVLLDRASAGGSLVDRVRGVVGGMPPGWTATQVLGALGTRRPPFSRGDVALVLSMAADGVRRSRTSEWMTISLVGQPVNAAERAVRQGGVGELERPIRDLVDALGQFKDYARTEAARYRARLVALLGTRDEAATQVTVDPSLVAEGDTWGKAWRPRLRGLTRDQRVLFVHLPLASGVTPSAAWRSKTARLAPGEGCPEMLQAMLADALASTSTQRPRTFQFEGRTYVTHGPPLADANSVIVRGAIWAAGALDEPWVVPALVDLGLHFGTSGRGDNETRDQRLANTAAAALGTIAGPEAIAGLGRMKAKITNRSVAKQIAKALEGAASRAGLTASELLELAVPTQGLDPAGRRELPVGSHVAVIALEGDDAVLSWRAPDGRLTARPPAAVTGETAAIARAKEEHKELRKALGVERGRVEDLFVERREWSLPDWRARYLDHPLTGSIGRGLIWAFRDGDASVTALADGDGLADVEGRPVGPDPDARVTPWHPIEAPEVVVAAWRARLLDGRIRQPFKQAFRETYVLTPAEEETETYSNRFAAHILRYPQARALMTARRWGSNFLGPYDGGQTAAARRSFPTYGIRAEFWHDALESELGGDVEHCTTDQVRFLRTGADEAPIPLREVPPIVFSEAMRDVDLFVSVTSMGADRNWQDGGRGRDVRFDGYWTEVWEQPLTATAEVRRDALARMLPGLAIADRLEIQDRWLEVRGDLRTYRIHLGSGNILMAPSDTYLCIVPMRGGSADRVFLPFDDDPTLSIILSKAFLLANDRKISDHAILRQIRGR